MMTHIFGDCELDDERCELWRAGAMVTVEPKVFKVLAHLVVHRNRVVTKDELLERFWPGTFVSESALTRCLTKVRQAVHDDHFSQRVIKTARAIAQAVDAEVLYNALQRALAPAEALGMHPLLVHCNLSIGTLYAHMGWNEQARAALSGAIELYRGMGMTFWLAGAEVVLAQMA